MKCRHCGSQLDLVMVDLGRAPPSNAYLSEQALAKQETYYPLRVLTCQQCWLVQTEDFAGREELFTEDYAYFSSYSSSWLAHAERYVAAVTERFGLGRSSHVVEVAANDGYLLQYFHARNIPSTGIEPTASTANAARAKGITIVEEFFGTRLAQQLASQGQQADLTVANNVLAHVPNINDFVAGFALLLKPDGVATFEFPHLVRLVEQNQFDTIYHEHFSYLSLTAVKTVFAACGLTIFDVEEHPTHGGSLRVFAQRSDTGQRPVEQRVAALLGEETRLGVNTPEYYAGLQPRTEKIKRDLLDFLASAASAGKSVGAYGAAAKGNTLLNFAGVTHRQIPWVVDKNPAKQGKYMPGSHIPIVDEARLRADRPDYVLILPWNLRTEVVQQLAYVREWGAKFVWAIPELSTQ